MSERTKFERLPKRVRGVIERCRDGQTLCKALRLKESGDTEITFFYEPSNKRCGPATAQKAISSGYLAPNNDGLLGPEFSQTWKAA